MYGGAVMGGSAVVMGTGVGYGACGPNCLSHGVYNQQMVLLGEIKGRTAVSICQMIRLEFSAVRACNFCWLDYRTGLELQQSPIGLMRYGREGLRVML